MLPFAGSATVNFLFLKDVRRSHAHALRHCNAMEVASLVISAVAFLDQAVKTGTTLSKLARTYPDAGRQIHNATRRLEAQRYTLQLWQNIWKQKATKDSAPLAENFVQLWGADGYDMILKALAQLNVKFGEALRTLRSIDPDSFSGILLETDTSS